MALDGRSTRSERPHATELSSAVSHAPEPSVTPRGSRVQSLSHPPFLSRDLRLLVAIAPGNAAETLGRANPSSVTALSLTAFGGQAVTTGGATTAWPWDGDRLAADKRWRGQPRSPAEGPPNPAVRPLYRRSGRPRARRPAGAPRERGRPESRRGPDPRTGRRTSDPRR